MSYHDGDCSNVYISLGKNQYDQQYPDSDILNDKYNLNNLNDTESTSLKSHIIEKSRSAEKKLILASIICAIFMIIEIVAGYLSNSLALITDALHLVSDLSSFFVGLFAIWISSLQGTRQLSFGYHRAEILGALLSVVLIWILTGVLVIEAIHRVLYPQPVDGTIMFVTAFFGTAANLAMTWIFGCHNQMSQHSLGDHHHSHSNSHLHLHTHSPIPTKSSNHSTNDSDSHSQKHTTLSAGLRTTEIAQGLQKALLLSDNTHNHEITQAEDAYPSTLENVNLRAAYLHVLGDLIQNIGVLIAALIIWIKPSLSILDPVCTFIFSIIVSGTTFSIMRDSTNVLMEGAPRELDVQGLYEDLASIDDVVQVHDLHVWSLSIGKPSLACHMVIDSPKDAHKVLHIATKICQKKYGILHTTIQIDFSPNKLACDTDAHAKCH